MTRRQKNANQNRRRDADVAIIDRGMAKMTRLIQRGIDNNPTPMLDKIRKEEQKRKLKVRKGYVK